jgi:hypothetical protein
LNVTGGSRQSCPAQIPQGYRPEGAGPYSFEKVSPGQRSSPGIFIAAAIGAAAVMPRPGRLSIITIVMDMTLAHFSLRPLFIILLLKNQPQRKDKAICYLLMGYGFPDSYLIWHHPA